jgi:hypothetical protein
VFIFAIFAYCLWIGVGIGIFKEKAVANGASELFAHIWGDAEDAARSTIGVTDIRHSSPVEV